ncbi:RpoE1: RNA polymerase sigma-E factor (sigma24) [Desulfosarcina variabilis str. Montpellier]|uniref:RNA polymerase sigma factor n=1 Tax=Desulfosarcina variabilis TaxID=2300 RepID=UPI003AFA8D43
MIFRSSHRRLSDADLVADVAQGDERAFAELLHRHQNAVYAFACRMLQDPQEAEDVTQETFLRLYQTSRRYRPTASLRAYLLRITKNICIDHFRKKRPELMDDLPDPATPQTPQDLLEGAVTTKYLEKAIDRLPVNQRTALLLRHTEQLSYSRIAEVMDVSIGAVESLLVRARRTLKQRLADLQE